MDPLKLNPLPRFRSEAESPALQMEREGFVDEAVVSAMIARTPYVKRSVAYPEDLALAADDHDFAGWSLPSAIPLREKAVPSRAPSSVFHPAPQHAVAEPEEDQPHRANLLWWLAGLACLLSAIFFCSVLFSFFSPSEVPSIKKGAPPTPAIQKEEASILKDVGQDKP